MFASQFWETVKRCWSEAIFWFMGGGFALALVIGSFVWAPSVPSDAQATTPQMCEQVVSRAEQLAASVRANKSAIRMHDATHVLDSLGQMAWRVADMSSCKIRVARVYYEVRSELGFGSAVAGLANYGAAVDPLYQHKGKEADDTLLSSVGRAFWLYTLTIPFALAALLMRMRRNGYELLRVLQYDAFGTLAAAVFYPLTAWFCGDSWYQLKRRVIEVELRSRLSLGDRLYERELELLCKLCAMPDDTWLEELDRLYPQPKGFVLMPRFAAYAVVFVSQLMMPLAQAHASPMQGVEVRGFGQVRGDDEGNLSVERVFVKLNVVPTDNMRLTLHRDFASGKNLEMEAGVTNDDGSVGLRAGQILTRQAFGIPAPFDEPVMGGPNAARYVNFFDIGLEGFWKVRNLTTAVGVLSGAGPNRGDNNKAKDGFVSVSWSPGPLVVDLVGQTGDQPSGWRTQSFLHAGLANSSLIADLHLAGEWLRSELSWAASVTLGSRFASDTMRAALGYDHVRAAAAQQEHILRVQVERFAFTDRIRLAVMAQWDNLTAWGGAMRLQASF